jgi:hypothetical protein
MTSLVEDHINVDVALGHLITRLSSEYGPSRSREAIEAAVRTARAQLSSAQVEVFVPILVERAARELLDAEGSGA